MPVEGEPAKGAGAVEGQLEGEGKWRASGKLVAWHCETRSAPQHMSRVSGTVPPLALALAFAGESSRRERAGVRSAEESACSTSAPADVREGRRDTPSPSTLRREAGKDRTAPGSDTVSVIRGTAPPALASAAATASPHPSSMLCEAARTVD